MHHIISLYGSAFPSIIAYTSREGQPDIQQGLPSINLFYCPGGDGNTPGLRAEMCTGLAMTGFSGHIGYLVINDGAFAMKVLAVNDNDLAVSPHRRRLHFTLEHVSLPN